ncbi:MAG: HD domain-containing protein [Chloroflexi bacterium]|nr:HD domain-containing protein [Chloroflexota bacterium]
MSVAHRIRQFFRALRPAPTEAERIAVRAVLTPPQYALFARLAVADQRHAVEVYRRVLAGGVADREVLQAALLHDVGKAGSGLRLWQRVAAVLLDAWAPGFLARLKARGPWRRAFRVYVRHPERGARLARLAGSSERVVTLIAAHQNGAAGDPALALLRQADDA